MSKQYLCQICKKESAYQAYGCPTSIVCKCKGLTEVGTLQHGIYKPNTNIGNLCANIYLDQFVKEEFLFVKLGSVIGSRSKMR
jgi:hypothetical protein